LLTGLIALGVHGVADVADASDSVSVLASTYGPWGNTSNHHWQELVSSPGPYYGIIVREENSAASSTFGQNHTLQLDTDLSSFSGYGVIGGGGFSGKAAVNTLEVTDSSAFAAFAAGGAASYLLPNTDLVSVTGNKVLVKTSWTGIPLGIIGGLAVPTATGGKAEVLNNSVEFYENVASATPIGAVFGAFIARVGDFDAVGTAVGNSVIFNSVVDVGIEWLEGAHVDGGRYSTNEISSLVQGNSVILKGDPGYVPTNTITNIVGGFIERGTSAANGGGILIEGNKVELQWGNVGNVYGGAAGKVYGATLKGNSVTISGDTRVQSNVSGAYAANDGTGTTSTAEGNTVNISGGTFIGYVSGAEIEIGNVNSNVVTLTGTSTSISGTVSGGYSVYGNANDNVVVLEGFSGLSQSGQIIGGSVRFEGDANRNTIFVKDSNVTSSLTGGWVRGSAGDAKDNEIKIQGNVTIYSSVNLTGGRSPADAFSGNTLTLEHVSFFGSFGNISNFENYDVRVSTDVARASLASSGLPIPLIPHTGTVTLGNNTLGTGTKASNIHIHLEGPGSIENGEVMTIFKGVTVQETGPSTDVLVTHNLSYYSGTLDISSGTSGTFTFGDRTPMEESRTLSELPLADVSFVNRGSDLLAYRSMPAAAGSVSGGLTVASFGTVAYGWSRTETGSHVDVKGFSGDVGIAFGTETSPGLLVAGLFVEFGDGSFDSYNEFSGISGNSAVHGEGDLSYLGGGAFARLDLGQHDASRPYLEAAVRFGKTDAEFWTSDLTILAREVRYDFDAKYWGFHAGGGYIIDFGKSGFDGTLDLSARYFHTHRDGDDVDLLGDRVSLSPITSSFVKAGARLTSSFTPTIRGYFGLYYEHEFDGDSEIIYAGMPLPKATLRGSTGTGELGLIVSSPSSPLEVQMGVEGSAGRRDGISGNLSLRFTF
jgi:hypothetical protein